MITNIVDVAFQQQRWIKSKLKFKLLDKLDITLTYWKHLFDSFIWHCTLCIHLNRFKIVAQEHGLYVVCLLGIVALVSSLQRVYLGGLLGNLWNISGYINKL